MSETTIRAFEIGDWEQVAKVFVAPNGPWSTLQMPFQSRDPIENKVGEPTQGPAWTGVVEVQNEDMKVVGIIGLNTCRGRRAHTGAAGRCVHDEDQNQGIGSRLLEGILIDKTTLEFRAQRRDGSSPARAGRIPAAGPPSPESRAGGGSGMTGRGSRRRREKATCPPWRRSCHCAPSRRL